MNTSLTLILLSLSLCILSSCQQRETEFDTYDDYPTSENENLWLEYSPAKSTFRIWSPVAEQVKLNLYSDATITEIQDSYQLDYDKNGIWKRTIEQDLQGTYYTFQIKVKGNWLKETPGIYAQAVGVNGNRAMVLDLSSTDPENWDSDKGPNIKQPNEAVIYELHIRDMTIHPNSGSSMPGKYLGLVEQGTEGPEGIATGIDHLKELGITHVHLLPTYDHYSIDETKLDSAQFNWGYDPQNYNVPEGSFSSDPYNAEVRIKEFKQMVKSFHEAGIGVILDVVYNHTGITEGSNFNLEVPGYYYRHWEDGRLSDASACGNETASDRTMMRKFIIESVKHWVNEYHLDGFRFDLMGIHDITTMNEITKSLKEIDPEIFIYGEGWTAGDSPLPEERRALKKHTLRMPGLSAFSDDIRDGIKGSVFDDKSTGFVSGAKGTEASVKFGLVGSIDHPQINYPAVNYSNAAWSVEPWQAISYVSCHDNHTLFDKLNVSRPDASQADLIKMDKLANGIVLTSQGVPFIHAGAEMLRTKGQEHNSYNLADSINQIDWARKNTHKDVFEYYKNLIQLRKNHPAFYLDSADLVRKHLIFDPVKEGLLSFQLNDLGEIDEWNNIKVIYNANTSAKEIILDGQWQLALIEDQYTPEGTESISGKLTVPAISMMILFQK